MVAEWVVLMVGMSVDATAEQTVEHLAVVKAGYLAVKRVALTVAKLAG